MICMHQILIALHLFGCSSPVFASSNYTFQYSNELDFEAELPLSQQDQLIRRTNRQFSYEQDTGEIAIMLTPYNEDVIVDLCTQTYDLNIKLCYFPRAAFLYPEDTSIEPTSSTPRHAFTPAQRAEFELINLDPRLVSLLEWLPYQREDSRERYTLWHFGTVAAEPFGRDLRYRKLLYGLDEWPLGKAEIALLVTYEREGHNLILNMEDNTIRDWNIYSGFKPARNAPDLLQEWVADILALRIIGWQEEPGSDEYCLIRAPSDFNPLNPITDEEIAPLPPGTDWDECEVRKYKFLKRTLEQEYGWPNNFQQERWTEEHEDVWREAARRYDSFP